MNAISPDLFSHPLTSGLGPLALPLIACALIGLIILIERSLITAYYAFTRSIDRRAIELMENHNGSPRNVREEVASIWLHKQRHNIASGIRPLHIIALLAPLLGLLGTVVGLIQVFDRLGLHQGPIDPGMLAEGLGIAMKTTAAGLIIALPSLLGAHGLQLWIDKILHSAEHQMNIYNLEIEGVSTEALA